jgi:hypothetical protein
VTVRVDHECRAVLHASPQCVVAPDGARGYRAVKQMPVVGYQNNAVLAQPRASVWSYWTDFCAWCARRGRSLPPTTRTVVEYLSNGADPAFCYVLATGA